MEHKNPHRVGNRANLLYLERSRLYRHWVYGRAQPIAIRLHVLTKSVDREGYNLILDTSRGTITEYSIIGYHIQVPYEEYENMRDEYQ